MKASAIKNTGSWSSHRVPTPSELGPVLWALRVAILGQALGFLLQHLGGGSIVLSHLFMTWGIAETGALWFDRLGSSLTLLCALYLCFKPNRYACFFIGGWAFLQAFLKVFEGGHAFSDWALFAHATRIVCPLALYFFIQGPSPAVKQKVSVILLRLATACTFAVHGTEALFHHPTFVDYIIRAGDIFLEKAITQPFAHLILNAIGAMDILLATLIMVRPRWKWPLAFMVIWGIITAGSRIVFMGNFGMADFLIRVPNSGAPLALLLCLMLQQQYTMRKLQ